jgi:hypothetical protein
MLDKVRAFLKSRKADYIDTFRNDPGKRVLADLAKFCRANEETFHTDQRVSAMLDGRRGVWLRIKKHLDLSPDELVRIYHPTARITDDE